MTDERPIKEHFERNRKRYILVSNLALAGITWAIVRKNTNLLPGFGSELLPGSEGPRKVVVNNATRSFSLSFLSGKTDQTTVNNAYTSIHTGSRGASGFVTKNLETNELFRTQGAAAKAFDIPANVLSSHLNGKLDDAYGYHFERVGVL